MKNITFLLSKAQLGENIGLSARAIFNFGFKQLFLINPRDKWPNLTSVKSAAGGSSIIQSTKVFTNFNNAIKKFDLLIACSARQRSIPKRYITLQHLNKIISRHKSKNIGVLFGSEANGLSNDEVSRADYILNIKTQNHYSSLNLSHAVLLVAYELSKLKQSQQSKSKLNTAKKNEITNLFKFVMERLPKGKKLNNALKLNFGNLLSNINLTSQDVKILTSIMARLSDKNSKKL